MRLLVLPMGHGRPSISFGAPAEDQMLIAASEGRLEPSGDDDLAAPPPLGRVAFFESDLEMATIQGSSKR